MGKVKFSKKNDIRIIPDTKDEHYYKLYKKKYMLYIKQQARLYGDQMMRDPRSRREYYEKVERIKQHRFKTLYKQKMSRHLLF